MPNLTDDDRQKIWEGISNEMAKLCERGSENRKMSEWMDAVINRVLSLQDDKRAWSREDVMEVWLVMTLAERIRQDQTLKHFTEGHGALQALGLGLAKAGGGTALVITKDPSEPLGVVKAATDADNKMQMSMFSVERSDVQAVIDMAFSERDGTEEQGEWPPASDKRASYGHLPGCLPGDVEGDWSCVPGCRHLNDGHLAGCTQGKTLLDARCVPECPHLAVGRRIAAATGKLQ